MRKVIVAVILLIVFGSTVFAAGTGDVAGAIESTWNDASTTN